MRSSMLMTGSSMHCTTEFSIELSDQDLTGLHDASVSAQRKHAPAATVANEYDLIEIELTPEEMDDLLSY
jgi:hypothetical protein